eukprot:TRINITY_DN1157_c0_g1_i1.p1 TRINITY_DN1157_c0_g1~~TRINITY_DN1157_c0_g1_i1.p1  ORF type:complete len:275 (+),score=41.77 TRINITY_DN1157_c0_g1_i1:29-853(+)
MSYRGDSRERDRYEGRREYDNRDSRDDRDDRRDRYRGDRYDDSRDRRGGGERRRTGDVKTSTCLFVGNLPYHFRERDIEDTFGRVGKLRNVTVGFNRRTGQSKGYAFVDYYDRREAEEAFDRYQGYSMDGRKLRLDWDPGVDRKGSSGPSRRRSPSPRGRSRSRSPRRYRSKSRSPRRSRSGDRRDSRRGSRSPVPAPADRGDRSPARGDRSPMRDNRSPARGDRSPMRDNRSPARGDASPMRDNRSPPPADAPPKNTEPASPSKQPSPSPADE